MTKITFFTVAFVFVLENLYGTISFGIESEKIKPELEVFSVTLPSTPGWNNRSKPDEISFGRSIGSPTDTFTISAREYPLSPEPVKSISELFTAVQNAAKKEAARKGRYELTSHIENSTNRLGLECVEYQKKWIDNGALATHFKKLQMEAKGLICIHPEAPIRLIEISYSSRSENGVVSEFIINEGEAFINSLKAKKIEQLLKNN